MKRKVWKTLTLSELGPATMIAASSVSRGLGCGTIICIAFSRQVAWPSASFEVPPDLIVSELDERVVLLR